MSFKNLKFICTIASVLLFCGCSKNDADSQIKEDEPTNICLITFRQANCDDVVKQVEKGKTLTDVPTPKQKTGYTISWDHDQFTNIQNSFVVWAEEIPNQYVVTCDYNGGESKESNIVPVTYNAQYELPVPRRDDYLFNGYIDENENYFPVFDNHYLIDGNLTLTAVWEYDTDVWKTITFEETGYPNVTRTIKVGQVLTDIPSTHAVTGYTVQWDNNFAEPITDDMVVHAVKTANSYNIYINPVYGVDIKSPVAVTYNEKYELDTLTRSFYTFKGYVLAQDSTPFKQSDIYTYLNDVELNTSWELAPVDGTWTDFYN